MANSHGHFGEFNSQLEDWHSYAEQLQNYFIANDIKSEAKQHAIYSVFVDYVPIHLFAHCYHQMNLKT